MAAWSESDTGSQWLDYGTANLMVAAHLVTIAAAVVAILFVRRLTAMQAARREAAGS